MSILLNVLGHLFVGAMTYMCTVAAIKGINKLFSFIFKEGNANSKAKLRG